MMEDAVFKIRIEARDERLAREVAKDDESRVGARGMGQPTPDIEVGFALDAEDIDMKSEQEIANGSPAQSLHQSRKRRDVGP